jgi:hypothetical protein
VLDGLNLFQTAFAASLLFAAFGDAALAVGTAGELGRGYFTA